MLILACSQPVDSRHISSPRFSPYENYFRDVKPFVLSLANQIKGYNTAGATPRGIARWRVLYFGERYQNALEREFHDHNKVSCDVECYL